MTRLVRWLYRRRGFWKRLLPIHHAVRVRLPAFELFVRLDDWAVGARIAVRRSYEPHVTAALARYLLPGSVVVDVGANIGYYTLLAATKIGPSGKVIAFEPSRENCALLQRSLVANHVTNVVLVPFAVADLDGAVRYGMDDSNGRITLDDRPELRQVRAVTLDRALAREPRLDVVKIDIEGAEGRALRGMRGLLLRHRPVVCAEFTPGALPRVSGVTPEEYLDELRALGYELSVVPRRGVWRHRPHTNAEIMAHFAPPSALDHLDVMALPRGEVPRGPASPEPLRGPERYRERTARS